MTSVWKKKMFRVFLVKDSVENGYLNDKNGDRDRLDERERLMKI